MTTSTESKALIVEMQLHHEVGSSDRSEDIFQVEFRLDFNSNSICLT